MKMKSGFKNADTQDGDIKLQENVLHVVVSSSKNPELISQRISLMAQHKIGQTLLNRIIVGCRLVEEKKEVGSLFPYLDVLVCPSLFIEAICDRNGEALNVYINDIVLANEGYHKKSIIQFVILENESYNDALNKEYLLEIINQVMIGHSSKITQEVLL